MKGLIIDTTLKCGYVAVFNGESKAVSFLDTSLSTQSSLIGACKTAMAQVGLKNDDLEGIAAVVGPGSFTGIRIGVTFANAMGFALSIPRYSFTSFELMQVAYPNASAYWLDAGHGSAYTAFPVNGYLEEKNVEQSDLPEGAVEQSALLDKLPQAALLLVEKAMEQRAFSACMPTAEREYLKPNYMRKSQAERVKEQKQCQ